MWNGTATPTRVTFETHRSEESSSRLLFETSDDLAGSVHVEAASDKNTGVLQLEKIIVGLENKFLELALTLGHALDNNKILIVTQSALAFLPPFGYTSHIQVTTEDDVTESMCCYVNWKLAQ